MRFARPRISHWLGSLAVLFLPLALQAACGPYNISAVPDKPFTADITLTDWQFQPDGSKVQVHGDATAATAIHIARDSSGRIAVRLVPEESATTASRQWTTWICDPGAGTTTAYRAASATATSGEELAWTGDVRQTPAELVNAPLSCRTFSPAAQNLGKREIQGLQVNGCRATVVANSQPVPGEFTERWWSNDLQSDLEGVQIDKTAGSEQQWILTNLEQADPDPSVFQPPAHLKMNPAPTPDSGGF